MDGEAPLVDKGKWFPQVFSSSKGSTEANFITSLGNQVSLDRSGEPTSAVYNGPQVHPTECWGHFWKYSTQLASPKEYQDLSQLSSNDD